MTGGEQSLLVGKFFNAKQAVGEDPRIYWQKASATMTTPELVFEQPIPKLLVFARFPDGLFPEYDTQKQSLLVGIKVEHDDILRVLRTRFGILKADGGKFREQRRGHQAFTATQENSGGAKGGNCGPRKKRQPTEKPRLTVAAGDFEPLECKRRGAPPRTAPSNTAEDAVPRGTTPSTALIPS